MRVNGAVAAKQKCQAKSSPCGRLEMEWREGDGFASFSEGHAFVRMLRTRLNFLKSVK